MILPCKGGWGLGTGDLVGFMPLPSTIIPFFMADAAPAPRLVVTDALGRRIVNIDKSLFTIGRRSETDLRLPGADISRVHAEITVENGNCVIRDKQSRFGTYVNGVKVTSEKVLGHGDQIKLGNSGDTEIVFFVDDEAPSVEKSAVSAATELRQLAALLEGLRALGSGRVLDEVLAMVLDSAIEVTGAERGFIMLANREKMLEFKLARARGKVTLSGRTFETSRKIPERVFATGQQSIVEDLLDGDLKELHTGTVALGIRHVLCTPLRLVRYVERAEQKGDDEVIGVLYLDSRERGALKSAHAQSALETLSAEAALAIENARLYREALDKAKFEQELKVAAAIQQSLLPVANREGPFFSTAAASIACRAVGRRLLRLRRSPDQPLRLHRRRRGGQGVAGGAARRRGARHVQRRGHVSGRRGDADDAPEPRAVPARDRGAVPDQLLRDPRRRRIADLQQRGPQRAAAGRGVRHPAPRDRRGRARPLRARDRTRRKPSRSSRAT